MNDINTNVRRPVGGVVTSKSDGTSLARRLTKELKSLKAPWKWGKGMFVVSIRNKPSLAFAYRYRNDARVVL